MTIKSMSVFFIDNQQMWPADAALHGNMVVWPDKGKYPNFVPVAIADHPEFEGKIVVQAGNRGLVVSLIPGAETPSDIRTALSAKETPEQYRVAVDAIIHAIMLMRADSHGGGECHPHALLTMLAKTSELEAQTIKVALAQLVRSPVSGADAPTIAKMVESAEEMGETLGSALAGA